MYVAPLSSLQALVGQWTNCIVFLIIYFQTVFMYSILVWSDIGSFPIKEDNNSLCTYMWQ